MTRPGAFFATLLVSAVSLICVAGCGSSGPELAKVTGAVVVNGQPVPSVMVEFQPPAPGSPSIGFTDSDGQYELQFSRKRWGALLGQHTVRLSFDYDPDSGQDKPPFRFPAQYNTASELTADVKSGSNTHNFDLQVDVTKTASNKQRRLR